MPWRVKEQKGGTTRGVKVDVQEILALERKRKLKEEGEGKQKKRDDKRRRVEGKLNRRERIIPRGKENEQKEYRKKEKESKQN